MCTLYVCITLYLHSFLFGHRGKGGFSVFIFLNLGKAQSWFVPQRKRVEALIHEAKLGLMLDTACLGYSQYEDTF